MRNYTKKELETNGFIIYKLPGGAYNCSLYNENKKRVFKTSAKTILTIRKRATRFLCGEYLYI